MRGWEGSSFSWVLENQGPLIMCSGWVVSAELWSHLCLLLALSLCWKGVQCPLELSWFPLLPFFAHQGPVLATL